MKTLALIPARSGSRGIPNKNLRTLGDKPLLEWSIDAALQVGGLDRIVVSAGNEEILRVAIHAGAEAFVRSEKLNGDTTPMIAVVKDAIDYCGLEDDDIMVLLQPTAPFRSVESVRQCVEELKGRARDSCMTTVRVPDRYHPHQLITGLPTGCGVNASYGSHHFPINRQDLEPLYVRAGTVYAFYVRTVQTYGNIYGKFLYQIEIPESEALNLDEMSDWHEAERRVKEENRATKAAQPSSVQGEEQAQPAAL
jgi:N-acylneuraminate cytidylyltransferase